MTCECCRARNRRDRELEIQKNKEERWTEEDDYDDIEKWFSDIIKGRLAFCFGYSKEQQEKNEEIDRLEKEIWKLKR